MSDPLDEFFEELEIIEEKQPPRHRNKRRPGGILNLLSGIFMAGTIGVGLLFSIIFINPQSSSNPLPPSTMPGLFLTYTPSSTPKPDLPPTWTPPISPTDTPTLAPLPTDSPMPTVKYSPTPATDLESGVTFDEQDGSPTSEDDTIHTDAGWYWLGVASQIYAMDGFPVSTQLVPLLSKTRVASTLTAPIPTDDGISDLFTPEIQYWEEDILTWAEEYGLDPNLIATVMLLESCGYTKAKSVAGALGLFQVMPQYFEEDEDPYDPNTNAYRGLSWLQITLKSSDSISMALAGYNAGLARARNPYLEWPNETQRYVNWGIEIYQDSKYGNSSSSALNHWLSKGGSALCYNAAVYQQDK